VDFPTLEKERTQFRVVEREALVDVDLLGFDSTWEKSGL
jgi:hypothetical protein